MKLSLFKKIVACAAILISLYHHHAWAQSTEVDEAFDPFSDYNEFEQDADEEADINFFKNGRYLTLGLQLGYRGFSGGGMTEAYTGAAIYGVQFSYFFDMQIAGSLGFSMGDHNVQFQSFTDKTYTQAKNTYSGSVNIQTIDLNVKYYFNTENVTRGLADLNPYVIVGAGQYKRTYNLSNQVAADPDSVIGFKAGLGLEIPLLRRRAYFGFQGTYHYVQFADENKHFIDETAIGSPTPAQSPIKPTIDGDLYDLSAIIGVNF
ncbi:MAG: outer membrane beta-barrel protein [Bdellovibrio sp.]|nr:outer membrane beta-barrel protein [Bdellovibrio sp.]